MIKYEKLKEWLIDYITDTIHQLESDSPEFNAWAKSFKRAEADFVVNMEFVVDWGDDERSEIPEDEAMSYGNTLMKVILDRWYI